LRAGLSNKSASVSPFEHEGEGEEEDEEEDEEGPEEVEGAEGVRMKVEEEGEFLRKVRFGRRWVYKLKKHCPSILMVFPQKK